MAEITQDELKGAVTEISNPNEVSQPFYTDNKERTIIDRVTMDLKPLEPAMRSALNRRGVNANGLSFNNLIIAFYNEFVLPKNQVKMAITYLSEHPLSTVPESSYDEANHADAITTAASVVTGIKSLAKNVRDKAKAKKAKEIADSGKYSTLTAYQKQLLLDYYNVPVTSEELQLGKEVDAAVTKLEKAEESQTPVSKDNMKKILIGAAIVAVIGLIIYFIIKKAK